MVSMMPNRERATALSVSGVHTFIEPRGLRSSNKELATQIHSLERKVSVHERNIAELADSRGVDAGLAPVH